ncbi:hypothetical protein FGB62_22g211 [Gracilaria domingensis]|nr:hypothetical protein FGB62_22g211 [Gracilaria domingensis]
MFRPRSFRVKFATGEVLCVSCISMGDANRWKKALLSASNKSMEAQYQVYVCEEQNQSIHHDSLSEGDLSFSYIGSRSTESSQIPDILSTAEGSVKFPRNYGFIIRTEEYEAASARNLTSPRSMGVKDSSCRFLIIDFHRDTRPQAAIEEANGYRSNHGDAGL